MEKEFKELSLEKQLAKKKRNWKKRQRQKQNRFRKKTEFEFDKTDHETTKEGWIFSPSTDNSTTMKKKIPGAFTKRSMEASEEQFARDAKQTAINQSTGSKEATDIDEKAVIAFISNLSYSCDATSLSGYLMTAIGSQAVLKVEIKLDPKFKKPKGQALVTLRSQEDLDKLLNLMDTRGLPTLLGRIPRIKANDFVSSKMLKDSSTSAETISLKALYLVSHHTGTTEVYSSLTIDATAKIDGLSASQFQFSFKESGGFYRVDFAMKNIVSIKCISQTSIEIEFDHYPFCYKGLDGLSAIWTPAGTAGNREWSRCQDPLDGLGGGFCRVLSFRLELSTVEFARALKLFRSFNLKIEPIQSEPLSSPPLKLHVSALEAWKRGFDDCFQELTFPVRFLLAALISKNCLSLSFNTAKELKDLLIQQKDWLNLQVLEDLHSRPRINDPIPWIREELTSFRSAEVESNAEDADYDGEDMNGLLIRRVYITPLRICPQPPEWDSANRIIRNYITFKSRFLRVTFTDENYSSIMMANTDAVFKRISNIVKNGFDLAGRHFVFLAYSSSQLREASCWFFDECKSLYPGETGEVPSANSIRESMGDLSKIKVVGKFAARLGQGFSTSIQTVSVSEEELAEIADVERNGYCFSDGVGMISMALAKEVASYLEDSSDSDHVPSAFQIRFAGCKGVVSVAPEGVLNSGTNLAFRASMKKFVGNINHRSLEVLAVSKPIKCYLNRQNIAILSSLGVEDKVFLGLMERMLRYLNSALENNESAMKLVLNNSVQSNTALAMLANGCDVKKDPHLFQLILAARNKLLVDLELKARILVEDGISLIGIMDETVEKILPEDCVFFQFRDNAGELIQLEPGRKVAICRNPCLHPGDIRVLTVFHSPLLEHLENVVVFSQRGERPNPHDMSGGDGDIYSVLFDPNLIPPNTYPPMNYSPPSPPNTLEGVSDDLIKDFYVAYLRNDNLGRIANAHMVFSDSEETGVLSSNCLALAELHSTAVDFNKTGVPAIYPRELFIKKYPQFMGKPSKMTYQSKKVLGAIYDRVINLGALSAKPPEMKLDHDFFVEGCTYYYEESWRLMAFYNEQLWLLMKKYDVSKEGEAVSGFCAQFSRKKSRVRGDDAASKFFHQVKMLQNECWLTFFDDLGIETDGMILARLEPEEQQRAFQKASACYFVTYDQYPDPPPFLSFCWIFYKLLCNLKKKASI